MMREIVLHGALREEFGGPFRFDVNTAAESLRALVQQLRGFRQRLRDGHFRLIRGSVDLTLDALDLNLGSAPELHVVPVVGGGSGLTTVLAGLALVAVAIAAPYAISAFLPFASAGITIGGFGLSTLTTGAFAVGAAIALTGVGQMLAKAPQQTPPDNNSFLFSGQLNVAAQGGPVPLVYGRFQVGSVVISTGLQNQQISSGGTYYVAPETG